MEVETVNHHLPSSVLVIDDDPTFCTIMRVYLRDDGYDVHLAYDAHDALSILESTQPDIILTDIMMPEIDGLDLIRQLRTMRKWKATPIVVISAKVMPEDRDAAKEAGANAFVSKPFTFKHLQKIIERVSSSGGNLNPQLAGF